MKKIISIFTLVLILGASSASAFDLSKVLGGKTGSGQTSGQSTGSSLGGALGGLLGDIAGDLLSTDNFVLEDIVGTWKYAAPAVSLEGSNVLQNLGGSAATSVIENKLAPYYEKAKINNLKITINADSTFTMNNGLYDMGGTVMYSQEEGLVFNFKAFMKVNVGKVKAQASKLGNNQLSLTFDVSKLQTIIEKFASVAQNQTLTQLSSLLSSYEGVYAGFKLNRVADSEATSTN